LISSSAFETAVVGHAEPAERRAGALGQQLPRHDVGVVLHLRDDDLVAGADPEPLGLGARGGGVAQGVRDEVDALGDVLGEHHLGLVRSADEAGDLQPRALVRLGRLLAELVRRPVDVGVVPGVELLDRVDHLQRLLRGVGAVEVDQRTAVADAARQDREVLADLSDVDAHVDAPAFVNLS
jgi:hypothetical protein